MANSLKLPVGIENFEEIRKFGFYYMDKTKLIEQLVCKFRFIGSPIPLATDQCFRL